MKHPSFRPIGVRRARRALGMSQTELAAALGTTSVTVWRWENGYHPISPPYARLLKILLDKRVIAA